MFYIVYKTTNKINGKFYIGTHKTKNLDDEYLGSGVLLRKAIEKYGRDSFVKQILFVFDNPAEMFAKEAEIVTQEFLSENNTYNLKVGGEGGWDFCNSDKFENPTHQKSHLKKIESIRKKQYPIGSIPEEVKRKISTTLKGNPCVVTRGFLGKTHSSETKEKLSLLHKGNSYQVGEKNSQYGTKWITDGVVNRKIKSTDVLPEGWVFGRI